MFIILSSANGIEKQNNRIKLLFRYIKRNLVTCPKCHWVMDQTTRAAMCSPMYRVKVGKWPNKKLCPVPGWHTHNECCGYLWLNAAHDQHEVIEVELE